LTLSFVAILAISVRGGMTALVERYGGQFDRTGRFIQAAAGAALILIGLREVLFF
jgi:hypothetical protein